VFIPGKTAFGVSFVPSSACDGGDVRGSALLQTPMGFLVDALRRTGRF